MTKIIKLVKEQEMCSLPWVHTEVNLQSNQVQPCCKYGDSLGKLSDGFANVWLNDASGQLRTDWRNGVSVNNCSACHVNSDAFSYKKAKNGIYSKHFDFLEQEVEDSFLPSVFNFSLSNTCNLACRMCGPRNSSKLNQLTKKNTSLQKFLYLHSEKNKISMDSLKGSFENARLVSFAGGEPFLDDDILSIIRMMKRESSNLTNINLSTNLTIINDDLLEELYTSGASVRLSFSLDGPKHINDYIRHHCDFNLMMSNLDYINRKYPNFFYSVNTTISILNVGYVTDTIDVIDDIKKNKNIKLQRVLSSPVVDKTFLHPSLLPEHIKKTYLDKLMSYKFKSNIHDAEYIIPTAIAMLTSPVNDTFDNFIGYTKAFDLAVGRSASSVYPEFRDFFN